MKRRAYWAVALAVIIGLGVLSRVVHTGWVLIDKYLGDALYAAMMYVLIRLFSRSAPLRIAMVSMTIMTVLEMFQLTMIPAHLLTSDHLAVRVAARLLGTEFAFRDLLAYAIGISSVYLADRGTWTVDA